MLDQLLSAMNAINKKTLTGLQKKQEVINIMTDLTESYDPKLLSQLIDIIILISKNKAIRRQIKRLKSMKCQCC
jgi:hypothetical protein